MADESAGMSPPNVSSVPSEDPLGQMLHTLRLSGVVYARSHLTAPWAIELPAMENCVLFHVVTEGECHLCVDDAVRILHPGDFALVPHGNGHQFMSDPEQPCVNYFDLPIHHISQRYETLEYGGSGQRTTLICGAVCFDHPAAHDLIEILPSMIFVESSEDPHSSMMQSALQLMAAEASAVRPGGETVITRLADILVIQAIRHWLTTNQEAMTGWLGALRDPRIGPALLMIHKEPERVWTVASLAEYASMSRSSFSARFAELVGMSPMQYCTRWRMQVAGGWLTAEEITVAECARRLGYESEATFSRAFKRVMGIAPGGWREKATSRMGLRQDPSIT